MAYVISKGPIPKKSEHKPGPKKAILNREHFDAINPPKEKKPTQTKAPPMRRPAKKAKRLNKKKTRKL